MMTRFIDNDISFMLAVWKHVPEARFFYRPVDDCYWVLDYTIPRKHSQILGDFGND